MAITSKQEGVMADIATTLANIDGTGNYNLNLGSNIWRVYRHIGDIEDDKFPCACVIDDFDTQYQPLTANEYTTGQNQQDVTSGWPVGIITYHKLATDAALTGTLQKEQIQMFSDVIIAMLADRTRGGNALSTVLLSSSKRVGWRDEAGSGSCSFVFIIKYDFNPTASTPTT
ncbi:MAG TPA: hypothetical protein ENH87_01920 [Pricia antarctica]|uniref:Uncharacterized protein n=1 Tax=Pricia antarctica TaxID=641691 RepID=A0A831QMF5_9FLAO|nr:hypothetical protein [Pricia antarctica]